MLPDKKKMLIMRGIFTHLKLCLAAAIHNFKSVKIIQIWLNELEVLIVLILYPDYCIWLGLRKYKNMIVIR